MIPRRVRVSLQYKLDEEKLALLLELPTYFDLEIYTTSRQEKVTLRRVHARSLNDLKTNLSVLRSLCFLFH